MTPSKILIVTDAWRPQINGVVRTIEKTAPELKKMGHDVCIAGPDMAGWRTVSLPFYPDIKMEVLARRRLRRLFAEYNPDYVHIATEGTLGWAARRLCMKQKRVFTTSYHTQFPEYVAVRVPPFLRGLTLRLIYALERRFHNSAAAVMVATDSIAGALRAKGFHNVVRWSRGVDTSLFRPYADNGNIYEGLPHPILLNVGRVAAEKNLDAFLSLDTPGTKIVIGDGPDLDKMKQKYPFAHFLGFMEGEALARHYAAADVFVFPSKTDTFGLVLLEAAAAGLRIAAYPAPGPEDILGGAAPKSFAALDDDLGMAIARALTLPEGREAPRRFAETYSWQACTRQFYEHMQAWPLSVALPGARSALKASGQHAPALVSKQR